MRKIPSLFLRDFAGDPTCVTRTVNPDCLWVLAGAGIATKKWDGTACLVREGALYVRYDCKRGKKPPAGFEPCQDADPKTGHWPGWIPAAMPAARWCIEAFEQMTKELGGQRPTDGTYEAVGPKIGGNHEGGSSHVLVRHGMDVIPGVPTDYDALDAFLEDYPIEGIVWHHCDDWNKKAEVRMAKIKRSDFGLPWPVFRGR